MHDFWVTLHMWQKKCWENVGEMGEKARLTYNILDQAGCKKESKGLLTSLTPPPPPTLCKNADKSENRLSKIMCPNFLIFYDVKKKTIMNFSWVKKILRFLKKLFR